MAQQLLVFNPAFLRKRGGDEPTGVEPQEVYAVNLFTLVETPPETQKVFAVNLFAVVEAP